MVSKVSGKQFSILCKYLLHSLNDYFKANKLKLNTSKTKLVYYRKKSVNANYDQLNIFLDGDRLKFEEEAAFLGITIDSHLSWEKHCTKVANTISRSNGAQNRVKQFLPPESLRLLYNSFILPHVQYGLAAWGGCSEKNKKRIVTIQKRAVRTVCKAYANSHTEPRMKKIGLLKLDDLYTHQCASLIHDVTNQRAPRPINDLLTLSRDSGSLNLRSHHSEPLSYRIPLTKNKVSANSFCCKAPQFWNKLPTNIQEIQSRYSFKNRLKNHLLEHYSVTTDCTNPNCSDRKHHH